MDAAATATATATATAGPLMWVCLNCEDRKFKTDRAMMDHKKSTRHEIKKKPVAAEVYEKHMKQFGGRGKDRQPPPPQQPHQPQPPPLRQEGVNGQSENLITSTTTLGVKRSALGEIGNNVVGCSNSVATLEPGALPGQKEFVKPIQRSYSTGSCINVKPPKDLVRPLPSPNIAARVKRTVSNTSVASVVLPAPQTQPSVKEEDAAVQPEDFVEDVDKADENNPLVVADYLDLLCSREEKYPIKKGFLHESYISPRMRAELVDWLVDVQLTLRLLPETLYFAVQILDRYLQAVPTVGKEELRLVAVAAMYVACNYDEEDRPPTDAFLSATKYNEELLLSMEDQIVKNLDSKLFCYPISLNCLRRFSKVLKVKTIHHYFSKFFLELALMEYSLCHVPPSLIAAAALYISLCILELNEKTGPQNWDAKMVHHSSYKLPEVEECAKALAAVIVQSSTWKYEAVKKKYSNSKMKEVALRQELTSECVIRLSEGKSPFP
ncbi:G2/mitotic-specific cyclin-B-like [Thrips palmi]|uniref:G2/mitotic-specific cyclin-B-like n=1 Tax=Thrips palmi TaxID=161013 RepID=A0A6P8Y6U4_THRPL|nr:G2/mitotic-specific cyclin-B-like [Thrips palmi]